MTPEEPKEQTGALADRPAQASASRERAANAHGRDRKARASAAGKGGKPARGSSKGYVMVAVVYLLGLFIGALDMGIVTPARTVIQNSMGVEDALGVWMLTIYTLAYAASIPIMGKLADKYGRKYVYLLCVTLFGLGSLLCGLSREFGSFEMLLAARAIQAVGGGGIMPVATAEFGTAFPEEKRGMALGLVGGVYGIANVFGASAGSAVLDIFGQANWQFIFYINVPICLFILIAGLAKLDNAKEADVRPFDLVGVIVMTVMVLSLMYGLKGLDFFNIPSSISSLDVAPYLIAFVVLLPLFVYIEHRAADPVMNLSYFKNRDIVITLVCSIATGIIMMSNIFLPQFCENSMMIRSGSGGYFVIILGVFAGAGSPMSGKLIDKFGVKPVLGFGFATAVIGSLFATFVACPHPNALTVVVSLVLIGLGMGFTMGTPLNYMMLQKTDDSESNSALATLSLVRSIGTAVAPAIMVAFVANAGVGMQSAIAEALPKDVEVSALPHAQQIDDELAAMKDDASFASMLEGVDVPKLADYGHIEIGMGQKDADDPASDVQPSADALDALEHSDVVTVVDETKVMAGDMFDQMSPAMQAQAKEGIDAGIEPMRDALERMDAALAAMSANPQAAEAVAQSRAALYTLVEQLTAARDGVPALFDEAKANYLASIDDHASDIQRAYQKQLNIGFAGMFGFVAVCCALGFALTMLYRDSSRSAGGRRKA